MVIDHTVTALDWTGITATAAETAVYDTVFDLCAHAKLCERIARVATEAAGEIAAIILRLRQLRTIAADYHLSIDDDTGSVTPPAWPRRDQREVVAARTRVQAAVDRLLDDAEIVDTQLATALDGADDSPPPRGVIRAAGTGKRRRIPVPPTPDATPEQVNAWWRSLHPDEQDAVKHTLLEAIRNRDGIPVDVRDELNRTALRVELTRLRNGWLDRTGWHTDRPKLADLTALRETLAAPENGNTRLILLDTGSNPRKVLAAVAVGDVDNADRVGVTVGGMTTRVSASAARMVSEAQAQRSTASRLRAAAGLSNADAVASIAYLGYDAPDTVAEVIRDDRARAAAGPLNHFYTGLAATTQVGNQHITAFGHSYGSLVTSLALQSGAPVGDVVLYGSPGVEITDAAQLGVGPGHAYYLAALHDRVADTLARAQHFGPGLAEVTGMTRLSVEAGIAPDGVWHESAGRHSDYPRPGGNGELRMSGYNMAAVLAGLPDKAVRPRALAPGPLFDPPPRPDRPRSTPA